VLEKISLIIAALVVIALIAEHFIYCKQDKTLRSLIEESTKVPAGSVLCTRYEDKDNIALRGELCFTFEERL
jgi:hypothetical protein